jgi:hypothetical protein
MKTVDDLLGMLSGGADDNSCSRLRTELTDSRSTTSLLLEEIHDLVGHAVSVNWDAIDDGEGFPSYWSDTQSLRLEKLSGEGPD